MKELYKKKKAHDCYDAMELHQVQKELVPGIFWNLLVVFLHMVSSGYSRISLLIEIEIDRFQFIFYFSSGLSTLNVIFSFASEEMDKIVIQLD